MFSWRRDPPREDGDCPKTKPSFRQLPVTNSFSPPLPSHPSCPYGARIVAPSRIRINSGKIRAKMAEFAHLLDVFLDHTDDDRRVRAVLLGQHRQHRYHRLRVHRQVC